MHYILYYICIKFDYKLRSQGLSDLLQPELPQSFFKRGRVAFLIQIHLHELVDRQVAGGRVLKLTQPVNQSTKGCVRKEVAR